MAYLCEGDIQTSINESQCLVQAMLKLLEPCHHIMVPENLGHFLVTGLPLDWLTDWPTILLIRVIQVLNIKFFTGRLLLHLKVWPKVLSINILATLAWWDLRLTNTETVFTLSLASSGKYKRIKQQWCMYTKVKTHFCMHVALKSFIYINIYQLKLSHAAVHTCQNYK